MLGANGCLMLCSLIPQAYTYIYTPPQTRIPHPGEGGGHGSQSHCQRPNGSESREHGRRLRVRFETVFLPQQVVPSKPRGSARSSRRLLRREREGRKIFGSSEDRAGDYVHGATMRVDRGRLRGSTDSSFHLEEAAQAQCRLAADAGHGGSGHARQSGAADASDNQHERRELAHVPLWPVAAVVGSVLRGIRIICNCVGVQATRCDSGTRWQTCLCNRVRAAISSTRRQRLRVGPSITHRQYRYRRRGVCNGLQSPGAGVRACRAQNIAPKDHLSCNHCVRVGICGSSLSEAAATARARARGSVRV